MKKIILGTGISILVLVFVSLFVNSSALGAVTAKLVNGDTGYTKNYTFFTATTTSATSTNSTVDGGLFNIAGAKRVALYFSRGGLGGNTGSSTFKIQVTPDGSNWYDYNTLAQNSATSSYPITVNRVIIETSTSTVITYMDRLGFYGLRCIVNEATDGEHTCKGSAEF